MSGRRILFRDYLRRATAASGGKHTPHLLDEAFAWHRNLARTGSMRGS